MEIIRIQWDAVNSACAICQKRNYFVSVLLRPGLNVSIFSLITATHLAFFLSANPTSAVNSREEAVPRSFIPRVLLLQVSQTYNRKENPRESRDTKESGINGTNMCELEDIALPNTLTIISYFKLSSSFYLFFSRNQITSDTIKNFYSSNIGPLRP